MRFFRLAAYFFLLVVCLTAWPGSHAQTVTRTTTKTVSKTSTKTIAKTTIAKTTVTKLKTTTKTITATKTLSKVTVSKTLPPSTVTQRTTATVTRTSPVTRVATSTITSVATSVSISTTTATSVSITTITRTTSTVSLCPLPTNFVKNPGFETGFFDWTRSALIPSGADTGLRCDNDPSWRFDGSCGWFATFPQGSTKQDRIYIFQVIKACVGPGIFYKLKFKYKATQGCTMRIEVSSNLLRPDGLNLGGTMDLGDTGTPSVWYPGEADLDFSYPAVTLTDIQMVFTASGSGGQPCGVSLDAISLSPVPR